MKRIIALLLCIVVLSLPLVGQKVVSTSNNAQVGISKLISYKYTGFSAHTGTTSETIVYTYKLPAKMMGPYSTLKVRFWALNGALAGTARYRVRVGTVSGTLIGDTATTGANANVRPIVELKNIGATNNNLNLLEGSTGGVVINNGVGTSSVDTSQSQDIIITCQLSNTADSVSLKFVEIYFQK